MLVKCPECQHDMSSEAAACPSCGHPNASLVTTPAAKKVSHSSGWISLAAFLLANFTPAILAPIFVLVGIIFAAKELGSGSKVFGALVLVLCLLQGWFVIVHFGQVRGTLGITTAKETDNQAAAQYANVSTSLPTDWSSTAQAKCAEEWPSDYRMQKHCIDQQGKGVQDLSVGAPAGVDDAAFRVIRGKCVGEWPRDFRMRAHCEKQQYQAYLALGSSSHAESARNACAQKWPDDYRMRQHCETHSR